MAVPVFDGGAGVSLLRFRVTRWQIRFIYFSQAIPQAPAVLLTVDDSVGTLVRLIGVPATIEFQIRIDTKSDGVNWIAMEPGDYVHGRYTWRVGSIDATACASVNPCTYTLNPPLDAVPYVYLKVHDTNVSGAIWARISNVTEATLDFRMDNDTEIAYYLAVVEQR